MKTFTCATAIVVLMSCVCPNTHAVEESGRPGRLHRIDIKATHPKAYHPAIGDVVQCYLDFPIVPEQIVENLQVATKGKSIAVIGVVNTSKPKIVGSGQISVYLLPRQPGMASLTIQPVIPGQKPKPIEIRILVQIRDESR